MGYDIDIFVSDVDINLICPICNEIFENPIQLSCDHTYCKACITAWFTENHDNCPVDRSFISKTERQNLKPSSRIIRNIINNQLVKCVYEKLGCDAIIELENRISHSSECKFGVIECAKGCGLKIKVSDAQQHNCVEELKRIIEEFVTEKVSLRA